jgi:hypothetical protein
MKMGRTNKSDTVLMLMYYYGDTFKDDQLIHDMVKFAKGEAPELFKNFIFSDRWVRAYSSAVEEAMSAISMSGFTGYAFSVVDIDGIFFNKHARSQIEEIIMPRYKKEELAKLKKAAEKFRRQQNG